MTRLALVCHVFSIIRQEKIEAIELFALKTNMSGYESIGLHIRHALNTIKLVL